MQRRTMAQASSADRLFEALPESRPGRSAERCPKKRVRPHRHPAEPGDPRHDRRRRDQGAPEIEADQIQPASLDLRLGKVAYRIRASFLPGPDATVRDKLAELKFHEIDLTKGAVLEAGCVYLVPLIEQLKLRSTIAGFANPKSSTGRLDVFTRLIADRQDGFDSVEEGYAGPLFAEICPRTFSIKVRYGSRLNQIRFRRRVGQQLDAGEQPGRVGDRALARDSLRCRSGRGRGRDPRGAELAHQPRAHSAVGTRRLSRPPLCRRGRCRCDRRLRRRSVLGGGAARQATAASCSIRTSSTSWPRRRACRCRLPMSPRWRRSIR